MCSRRSANAIVKRLLLMYNDQQYKFNLINVSLTI